MKILMLTSRLPYPPDRGDRLRVYHFARVLSEKHQLTLITFISRKSDAANLPALENIFSRIYPIYWPPLRSYFAVLSAMFRDIPLQVGYYHSRQMNEFINRHLTENQYDLIYTHLIRMAPYTRNLRGTPKILDMTDVISTEIERSLPYRFGPSRWLYQLELPRLRKYEAQAASDFDACWLISKAEVDRYASLTSNPEPQIVNNGIDAKHFFPDPKMERKQRLIFVGHLGVYHNVDAARYLAREIWPIIHQEYPEYQLDIVGAGPAPEVLQLAELQGVNVHGYVQDLNQVLNQSAMLVAPLRFAAGIQNKVLEAMATATPVVTTSLVNEGIEGTSGHDLIVADTPREIILAIKFLINQPAAARQIGQQGFQFVRNNFSWQNVQQAIAEWLPAIENSKK